MNFNILSFIHNSAKSRIKGTLEIYHAFIHEQREPAEPDANSGDWEHVENVSLTGATQTTVSTYKFYYSTQKRKTYHNLTRIK